jgi:hypothetical protein
VKAGLTSLTCHNVRIGPSAPTLSLRTIHHSPHDLAAYLSLFSHRFPPRTRHGPVCALSSFRFNLLITLTFDRDSGDSAVLDRMSTGHRPAAARGSGTAVRTRAQRDATKITHSFSTHCQCGQRNANGSYVSRTRQATCVCWVSLDLSKICRAHSQK